MNRSAIPLTFSLLLSAALCYGQDQPPACADLREGVFYSYPKNTHERYICVRGGSTEVETNLDTGDSSVWEIQWQDDCSYTMAFLSGNDRGTKGQQEFLAKHRLAMRVEKITGDYYVYAVYVDRVGKQFYARDTFWLHEKMLPGNDRFTYISSEEALQAAHFSDTSGYAVICLYRPRQFTLSLTIYPVYCNDTLVWMAHNRWGCMIKVRKEGEVVLTSRLFKDKSAVKLDVHFGHVYFIRSMIHWGMYSRLYNFKLEMAAVPVEQGQPEFRAVHMH
jgi:hypothetical protein